MLKHLLISILPFFLLWVSQTSIQITAMSDLGEVLITLGFTMSERSLKIWLALIITLMLSDLIEVLVPSIKYGILIIFKYDFDWESLRTWTLSDLIFSMFFTYLSITWRSDYKATKLETIVIPIFSRWMKLAMTLDLTFLNTLLMLATYLFTDTMMLSTLTLLINYLFSW